MSLNKTQYVVDTLDLLDDKDNCQRRIRIGKNKDMEIYKHDAECVIELKDGANVPLVFKNGDDDDLMTLNNTGVSIETLTTATHVANVTIQDLLIELGNGRTGDPSDDVPIQNPSGDSGIVMIRGNTGDDNAFMGFDDSENKFIMGTGTFTGATSGDLTVSPGTLQVAEIEGPSGLSIKGLDTINIGTTEITAINIGHDTSETTVNGNLTVVGTLDSTGDTSVSTFDSSGATSLATEGGVVNIASTGVMTTIKGTLNVDEAVSLDSTLTANTIQSSANDNLVIRAATGNQGIITLAQAVNAIQMETDSIIMTSSNSNNPLVLIKNTFDDANPPRLTMLNERAAPAGDDECGAFAFSARDDANNETRFAEIKGIATIVTNGSERGQLSLSVAEFDGNLTSGLTLYGTTTDGQVDVTIGAGAASTTTIVGTLDVNGTLTANGGIESKNGTSGSGFIDLYEDSGNGTNKIRIIAPSNVASDITLTLPDGDGDANQALTTDGDGNLSWADAGVASSLNDLTDVLIENTNENISMYIGHEPANTDGANGNIGIGSGATGALGSITTGDQNTAIGTDAASSLTTGTNNIVIGYQAAASAADVSNEITLGNADITTLRCADTTIASLSDRRDKTHIVDSYYGLKFINTLKPRQFTWQTREKVASKDGKTRVGFIAQELQEAMPNNENEILDLVYESNPDKLEAKYGNLVPILVKAVQELTNKVNSLEKQLKNKS